MIIWVKKLERKNIEGEHRMLGYAAGGAVG
jgi:hypothetical protein